MLLTERQITAQEACDGGLVTRIFSEDRFRDEVDKVVKHMASLPPQVQTIFLFWYFGFQELSWFLNVSVEKIKIYNLSSFIIIQGGP